MTRRYAYRVQARHTFERHKDSDSWFGDDLDAYERARRTFTALAIDAGVPREITARALRMFGKNDVTQVSVYSDESGNPDNVVSLYRQAVESESKS